MGTVVHQMIEVLGLTGFAKQQPSGRTFWGKGKAEQLIQILAPATTFDVSAQGEFASTGFGKTPTLDFNFNNPQNGDHVVLLSFDLFRNSGAEAVLTLGGDLTWTLVADVGTSGPNGGRILLYWTVIHTLDAASLQVTISSDNTDVFSRAMIHILYSVDTVTPFVQTVTVDDPAAPGATETVALAAFATELNVGFSNGVDTNDNVTGWTRVGSDPFGVDVPSWYHVGSGDAVWDVTIGLPVQLIAVELSLV